MKAFFKSAVVAAAVAVSAPSFAADIIVVSHGQASDPFWSVVKNGVEQGAKHTGAKVSYRAPETFDMVAMSQLIDAAVNQEPDGLSWTVSLADASVTSTFPILPRRGIGSSTRPSCPRPGKTPSSSTLGTTAEASSRTE